MTAENAREILESLLEKRVTCSMPLGSISGPLKAGIADQYFIQVETPNTLDWAQCLFTPKDLLHARLDLVRPQLTLK